LKELWSDRLLETLIPTAPELHFVRRVIHVDLQRLDYDPGDMYTLTPKIKEDIEFQKGLIVKLKAEKFPSEN
jgi:hypothetical protein